jgi:imidazolonepropionase-like amidohydrolase
MTRTRTTILPTAFACAMLGAVGLSHSVSAQNLAITNGTVITGTGERIDGGTIVIMNGRIHAVGTVVPMPLGIEQLDATGMTVTPGFVAFGTQLGLVEIGSVDETREGSRADDAVTPSFNVLEGINPASQLIPVTRTDGVTTALTMPSGGLISGQAVLVDLVDGDVETMLVRSPAALVASVNRSAKSSSGGSRAAVMDHLRRLFDNALEYDERRSDFTRRQMQELAAPATELEALLPALRGEVPVILRANRQSDIANALRLAEEYGLDLILLGAAEGWQMAEEIAVAGATVALYPLTDVPSYDGLSPRLDNAALLRAAGVRVIIATASSHNAREVRHAAGNAVAYGMDWDAALAALTLEPATALGVGAEYGSLTEGKVGNLVVWSGDPFELSTAAVHVVIRGEQIPMASRQRALLERYRALPPSYFEQ